MKLFKYYIAISLLIVATCVIVFFTSSYVFNDVRIGAALAIIVGLAFITSTYHQIKSAYDRLKDKDEDDTDNNG